MYPLPLIALLSLLLVGCNTVHGFGEDMQKGGEAIQNVSKDDDDK
ncbi:MAG TPA: entericidin A/B family lipoprotein [Gammaproteobacteria bacterium]|nr:entericidin A/B family lipoprotein [Gammaproteobacteria bacterium]